MNDLVLKGLSAKRESKYIDFKTGLDLKEPHTWCELIKDIIAMANSGGGLILVGLNNNGQPSGFDPTPILNLDPAIVCDKIRKYTNIDFDECEISEQIKNGSRIACILVRAVSSPIVFTSPGTYRVSEKKQKTAFSNGTIYFRHGAKSEPGTTEDIRKVVERQVESIRKVWASGVRKVVKAPPDHQIVALAPGKEVVESHSPSAMPICVTNDPSAPAYRKLSPDKTHPYRQTELVDELNKKLHGRTKINQYDIQVIKKIYRVTEEPKYVYQPRFSSTQYSDVFVDWVVGEYERDSNFFANTRREAYRRSH
jgi:hypothetical protein